MHRALCSIFFLLLVSMAHAQDAVPSEILARTHLIHAGNEMGTAFSIDHEGKVYLVTARHVVSGIPTVNSTIQLSRNGTWLDCHIVRVLFPPSNDVDIAVMETTERVSKPFEVAIASGKEGPSFGQQVWFIGYPWGLHTHVTNGEIPFIKRGTFSAIDATNTDAVVLYIDGFNNPGFSGGPIVYWDFNSHAYRLIAVVKGYREDSAKVIINGQHNDTPLLVNSGILIAYNVRHAIQAIEQQTDGH